MRIATCPSTRDSVTFGRLTQLQLIPSTRSVPLRAPTMVLALVRVCRDLLLRPPSTAHSRHQTAISVLAACTRRLLAFRTRRARPFSHLFKRATIN